MYTFIYFIWLVFKLWQKQFSWKKKAYNFARVAPSSIQNTAVSVLIQLRFKKWVQQIADTNCLVTSFALIIDIKQIGKNVLSSLLGNINNAASGTKCHCQWHEKTSLWHFMVWVTCVIILNLWVLRKENVNLRKRCMEDVTCLTFDQSAWWIDGILHFFSIKVFFF